MDRFHHAPFHRLLCPRERFKKDKHGQVIIISEQIHHIINSSYFISDAEDENSNHLHLLCQRQKEDEEDHIRDYCWVCWQTIDNKTYYRCSYCNNNYHKECVESPSELYSSDHPKHPLQLLWHPSYFRQLQTQCFSCRGQLEELFYYCSICDFSLHPVCAGKPTSLTIDNPKRHKHTLYYFSRISALVCDVCGLEGNIDYLYVCLLCDFIVHKRCVHLPFVIKVSRHDHRLAFTPNLPYKDSTDCGVCHEKIKKNYGEYSCRKDGCVYAVHSRCIMQSNVCDMKELEEEPEETYENTKMFEEIGDGIIQHSTHQDHQLRLEESFHNESKHCQACRRPSYCDGNVYRCLQCDDFILHESCAYIPRVKQFMLHVHPLTLDLEYTKSWFSCGKCYRVSCGYAYECRLRPHYNINSTCIWTSFDILCASIREPFVHRSHPHPLFITCAEYDPKMCTICQSKKGTTIKLCGMPFCFVLSLCHSTI